MVGKGVHHWAWAADCEVLVCCRRESVNRSGGLQSSGPAGAQLVSEPVAVERVEKNFILVVWKVEMKRQACLRDWIDDWTVRGK